MQVTADNDDDDDDDLMPLKLVPCHYTHWPGVRTMDCLVDRIGDQLSPPSRQPRLWADSGRRFKNPLMRGKPTKNCLWLKDAQNLSIEMRTQCSSCHVPLFSKPTFGHFLTGNWVIGGVIMSNGTATNASNTQNDINLAFCFYCKHSPCPSAESCVIFSYEHYNS